MQAERESKPTSGQLEWHFHATAEAVLADLRAS